MGQCTEQLWDESKKYCQHMDLTLQTPQQTYPRHWHLPQAAWLGVLAWGGIVTVELTIMRKWEHPMTRNRMEASYQALAGLLKMLNFELPTQTWSQNVNAV